MLGVFLVLSGLLAAGQGQSKLRGPSGPQYTCEKLQNNLAACPDQKRLGKYNSHDKQSVVPLSCSELNGVTEDQFEAACKNKQIATLCECTCFFRKNCNFNLEEYYEGDDDAGGYACFSGDALVETPKGSVTVRELRRMPHAHVRAVDPSNRLVYSPVRLWIHSEPGMVENIQLETDSGHRLSATRGHLVYEVPCGGGGRMPRFVEELEVGRCLLVEQDGAVVASAVRSRRVVKKDGRYTFSTDTGTVLVNGVAASNYALTANERLTHWFFSLYYHLQSIIPADSEASGKLLPAVQSMLERQKAL